VNVTELAPELRGMLLQEYVVPLMEHGPLYPDIVFCVHVTLKYGLVPPLSDPRIGLLASTVEQHV